MKLDTKWVTLGFKSLYHFPGLSVPEQYLFIIAGAQKATAVICKANISDCLRMSLIRPYAPFVCVFYVLVLSLLSVFVLVLVC